ncbi:hypothetical protein BBJ28_00007590 [Nothophytophthora sp. Chile5]|nr:hypothetical protein BBJ28_00007590 [Nothophytophthora sp. Chile5]
MEEGYMYQADWQTERGRGPKLRGGARERSESSSSSASFIPFDSGSSSNYSPRECAWDGDEWIPESHSPQLSHQCEDEGDRYERYFLEAADSGDLHRVTRFLGNHYVNIDSADANNKQTALMKAVQGANPDVTQFLLRHKADVNAADSDGRTALMLAAEKGKVAAVQLLLAKRSIAVNQTTREGTTALMLAAWNGHIQVLQCLLKANADLNASAIRERLRERLHGRRPSVDTAVLLAAKNGHVEAMQFLMAEGAELEAPRREASRLLVAAATTGRIQVMRCLIELGADLNFAGRNGETALMQAAEADQVEIARTLLEHGADLCVRNEKGQTAMSIAVDKGNRRIQQLLVQYEQVLFDETRANTLHDGELPSWAISPTNVELREGANGEGIGDVGIGEFRAKWLDADVVVKLFVPDAASTSFQEEVAQWHQLRHPNVIKLYGACDRGHYFFVREHARHGSVTEYLAACDPKDRTPWKFLHGAALGLFYLHERQIIHGNLRGSNILVGSDGQAKLADFAVSGSTLIDQSPDSSGFMGPVRWQSPERLRGSPASFSSDIYSLGMCILEVVSGAVPWKYEKSEDNVFKQVTEYGVQFLGQPRGFAKDEWSLIKSMCASSPDERLLVSKVADTLEFFVAREKAKLARLQPEPEPSATSGRESARIDLIEENAFNDLDGLAKNDIDRYILYDFEALHEQLGQPKCRGVLTQHYNKAFLEFRSALRASARQDQVNQLMATRDAVLAAHSFHRKAGVLWETVHQLANIPTDREERWQQARAQHFDAYVLKLLKVCQSPSRQRRLLTSENDWSTFLGFLRAEIDLHPGDYTGDQLSTITQAYQTIADQTHMAAMLPVTPAYYIPRSELQTNARAGELGAGSFGRVRTAKWLDSEVVVKEVKLDGDANSPSASGWAMSASTSMSMASTLASASENPERQGKRGEALRMFRRELELWYGLSHPHVVRLFGACHIGAPFFVCEYAKHGTLVKFLEKHPDRLWRMLHEAALGVQYLHERRIAHGDLKGDNIVIGDDGSAKVTDFGLSSMMNSEGRAQISGAVQWVAPECLGDGPKDASPQSDVYSLGMCIIQAMRVVDKKKSSYPWGDIPDGAVLYHVKDHRKIPLRPSKCTDAQWGLVERMCKYDPSERIEIIAVVDELEKLVEGSRQGREEAAVHDTRAGAVLAAREGAESVVAEMKQIATSSSESDVGHKVKLARTYRQLWSRIERAGPSSKIEEDALWCDAEFLGIVADASDSTKRALASPCRTLVRFTELALHGYSLHRRLDKLIASKRLSPHADVMLDLGWKEM